MLPLIQELRKIHELQTEYLIADLGYLDAEDQKSAFHDHDMAVVTGCKKNTTVPESCEAAGRPECEQGLRLIGDGANRAHSGNEVTPRTRRNTQPNGS